MPWPLDDDLQGVLADVRLRVGGAISALGKVPANQGDDDALLLELSDPLPPELEYVPGSLVVSYAGIPDEVSGSPHRSCTC